MAGGRTGWPGTAVGLLTGAAVLAPVLGRGYVLSYDMVFVPHPPITATVLGTDGSVPRAVPTDLAVDLLARVIPAAAVQQTLLLAIFVLSGAGAARLAAVLRPGIGASGRAAAALAYCWNPYVAERLVVGHWAFLLGYAVLPWVAGAALTVRRTASARALPALLLWLAAAATAGSTAGVLAAGTALVILAAGGARSTLITGGFALAVNLPWLVPALARAGGIPADPAGVAAFAARPDTPFGVAGSLATLGGVWNEAAWPAGRDSWLLAGVALGWVAAAGLLGCRPARWGPGGPGLAAAGFAGYVVAAAGTVPVLRGAVTVVVLHVPGGGLLRDGQKFLAPTALLIAVAAGCAVDRLAARDRRVTAPFAVLLAVLPVLALPALGWGVAGRLQPARYPASWSALQETLAAAPASGDVAVLPWGLYRRFGWNGDRVVLDPLPRLLSRRVLVDDDLPLSSVTVRGEDSRSARVSAGLRAGTPVPALLRSVGVRYVVVHRTQVGAAAAESALAGLPVRYRSRDLLLVELPGALASTPRPRPWLAAGLVVAVLVTGCAAIVVAGPPSGAARIAVTGGYRLVLSRILNR